MLLGCVSENGIGNISQRDGIMYSSEYQHILEVNLTQSGKKLKLTSYCLLQQDDYPKNYQGLLQEMQAKAFGMALTIP